MSKAFKDDQMQTCPQCVNHCPVDALQCGRFVRHSRLEDVELFQALADEEKAALQAALEKLAADWKTRWGEESFGHGHHHGRDGEGNHHKHGGHDK